jgi:hypothetical protein
VASFQPESGSCSELTTQANVDHRGKSLWIMVPNQKKAVNHRIQVQ